LKENNPDPIKFREKLLILDDVINNPFFKMKNGSILDELIIKIRHVKINIIILS